MPSPSESKELSEMGVFEEILFSIFSIYLLAISILLDFSSSRSNSRC